MNGELLGLFEADQLEHSNVPQPDTPEYSALRVRDSERRERALAILQGIPTPSAEDLFHAAWLFNHGDSPEDALTAHRLAMQATALGHSEALWLSAASYDRHLMYSGKPQKYGTQIVPDGERHRVWDTDPRTTDEERARFNVPPIAEMYRRAGELTKQSPQPSMRLAPEWLKHAIARWRGTTGAGV